MATAPVKTGVVLTVDGAEVEVAAGTGLVEAAAAAGIEIPVFCYEPRIGPAVGACRMCMVEIEGMPKLQTACSTGVRDGMVVSTVSDRAREAQDAVLEFLLINHPLDCPVCDKGGECPLQDLTFRWGPGMSRFLEIKRTNDKPIPISPLIALDRERCILCYRCTRFSSDVAQDGQLIARERGANSIIATFEGQPYEGHFSGNIIELCPVGALTSTEYRFKGRPWETVDHPAVCGLCPVGCNTNVTVREGAVARVLARENTDVDEGWLCDRGRFSYPSLYAPTRLTEALVRSEAGAEKVAFDVAVQKLWDKLWHNDEPVMWVLSGAETLEETWAIQRIARLTGGRVVAAEGGSAAGPRRQATLADLENAEHVLVIGDAEVVEVAPIVDLRIRKAMRNGAQVTVLGIGGTKLEPAGATLLAVDAGNLDGATQQLPGLASNGSAASPEGQAAQAMRDAGRVVVVFRDGEISEAAQDALVSSFGLDADGSGLLALPAAPNARGLAAMGVEPVGCEALVTASQLVFVNVDPAAVWPADAWQPVVDKAKWVAAISMLPSAITELADVVIPGAAMLEKDGTLVNLEGRLQRTSVTAEPPAGIQTELQWLSTLHERGALGRRDPESAKLVPGHAAGAFRKLAAAQVEGSLPATHYRDIPDTGVLGVRGGSLARSLPSMSTGAVSDGLTLFLSPALYAGDDVEHAPRMQFLRENTWITISREDADKLGLARRERVKVSTGSDAIEATVAISHRISPGHARMAYAGGRLNAGSGRYVAATIESLGSV